jgi:hypothetical protein
MGDGTAKADANQILDVHLRRDDERKIMTEILVMSQ